MSSLVKAHEFFGQMQREDCTFRLLNSNIGADDTVLRGTFSKTTVRSGLTVHYSDVTNLCDLHTEAESAPHLGVKLFFQGGVSASIGDQDIPMPHRAENSDRWIPSATLFHQQERELFRRRAAVGDRVRKLTIKIFPEWLEFGRCLCGCKRAGPEALHRDTACGTILEPERVAGGIGHAGDQAVWLRTLSGAPIHGEPHAWHRRRSLFAAGRHAPARTQRKTERRRE